MGRFFLSGPDATALLRRAVTYNVTPLGVSRSHYAVMCNEDGGILDDVYAYHIDPERWLLVVNAANREATWERIQSLIAPGMDVETDDRTESTVMLALQGPEAAERLADVLGPDLPSTLRKRRCLGFELMRYRALIARTGYTGEDGFEFVTAIEAGQQLWDRLIERGVAPCGLGARDTLRLEASLVLYGNDIDATTNPFEAGLGWVVSLDDEQDFVGRQALLRLKAEGVKRRLVCLKARERGIIRAHYPILHDGAPVGHVTSGGYSPMLDVSIGMGYVPVELSGEGTPLTVDVRGRPLSVEIVPRPFYQAPSAARG
jgi:aminomethyltransferase